MFSNGRKTIGIFTEAVDTEFPSLVCQGIIQEAQKRGYNVTIFTCYGNYGHYPEFYKGECKIFDLPPYDSLDGAVLLLDTIQDIPNRERVQHYVQSRCHCPIISIREKVDGVNNLLIDNRTCMESITRHFIDKHKFKRLCFMTGPKDRWYSIERLECFLRVMEEYHLPVNEHQIFYGDFWKNMGIPACDWFLSGRELPQAILCANDHMAVAVTSELINRGYDIPKDICVSGYDGLTDTLYFSPSVTTVGVPFLDMGIRAVQIIDQKQRCPMQCDDYFFDVQVIPRESCGCQKIQDREVIATRRNWYEDMLVEDNRKIQFNFFSINLNECTSIDQISDRISQYIGNIEGYQDYCLCLNKDLEKSEDLSTYSTELEVRFAIRNNEPMGPLRIPFKRTELLPPDVTSSLLQAWYFSPLHFENETFGYEAFQFKCPEITGNIHFDWCTNVGNAIRNVLLHHKMEALISELQYMYNRDSLTGMYNRRGFEKWASLLLSEARQKQHPFFLAIIDLDGMKQINDTYGHIEGDFALKKVRDAIWNACHDAKTNARTGGDEFIIYFENTTEEQGCKILEEIESFLDRFNQCREKPYEIHASTGYMHKIPTADDNLETFVKNSDAMMYENKIKNKRRRNEPLR